ncbi:MAG: SCP2 sterol-binding domain-containing protein [Alphaproteobacteria bacterium]|nr:SCP2 sterol-binding domain-containing protein [Alphaproteobacteria bacterium]
MALSQTSLPLPLMRVFARYVPFTLAQRLLAMVVAQTKRRHPSLVKNLAALAPVRVYILPTDVRFGFLLTLGQTPLTFTLTKEQNPPHEAKITGSLQSLVALLEGEVDGDQLFFTRDLQITGDTEAIVGLRNTLDRETIDLCAEMRAALGPLGRPLC